MSKLQPLRLSRISYNSCRNRHCPKCQNKERAQWLERRKGELLPVEYFHVVFTIPEPLAPIAFHNQEVVYGLLFRAASETLRIARDPQHLGAEIGFFAVLHTWGQNLLIIRTCIAWFPGRSDPGHQRWIGCRPGFFLPVKVLSRLYRRLFLTRLPDGVRGGPPPLLWRSEQYVELLCTSTGSVAYCSRIVEA